LSAIERAFRAAGELRETSIRYGDVKGEQYFEFSGWEGFSGGCHAFLTDIAHHDAPGHGDVTMSLDIDGLSVEDVERVFRVLRLGRAADRALDQATAYAAQREEHPEGGE
jgi:hypothetical protein